MAGKDCNLGMHITNLENLTMPLLDWSSFLQSLSIKDQRCFIISSISLFESGPKDHIIDKFVKFQVLTVTIFCLQ